MLSGLPTVDACAFIEAVFTIYEGLPVKKLITDVASEARHSLSMDTPRKSQCTLDFTFMGQPMRMTVQERGDG